MWTKLDDALESHQKLTGAALLVKRPAAYTRALGAFALALLHANRYLTDGFVPYAIFVSRGVPTEDLDALVAVKFLVRDDASGGFWIHDFLDHNLSAAEVKAKQKRDRDRKKARQGFHVESAATPSGVPAESIGSPNGFPAESVGSSSRARTPGPARPGPTSTDQEHNPALRAGALSEVHPPPVVKSTAPGGADYARPTKVRTRPADVVGFETLAQVAKHMRREHPDGDRGEILEHCKAFCATSGLAYDSTTLHKALDAVEHTVKGDA